MHSIFISKQVDRILAVGLLLLVISGAYLLVQHVYLAQIKSLNSEIEFMKKKNAKIDSILSEEEDLDRKIKSRKKLSGKNKIFLVSSKHATAASELQNFLKRVIATHSKGKILTIKPYPVIEHDNYSEASLEIRIRGIGHQGLHKILYQIETNAPILVMKELDIKLNKLTYATLVKSKTEDQQLSVTMVVSGFYRDLSRDS